MVAGFQDDLDSEDDMVARVPVTIATEDISSDEEEAPVSAPEIQIAQDEDYEFEKIDLPKPDKKSPKPDKKLSKEEKVQPVKSTPEKDTNVSLKNGHKESVKQTVVAKDSDKKDRNKPAPDIVVSEKSDEEEEEEEENGIQILQDKEDISEDEQDGGPTAYTQQEEEKVGEIWGLFLLIIYLFFTGK